VDGEQGAVKGVVFAVAEEAGFLGDWSVHLRFPDLTASAAGVREPAAGCLLYHTSGPLSRFSRLAEP
jgi:hypothetical protein